MSQKLSVVDLFCGAGGLSFGFVRAGYEVKLGTDIDPTYGKTFLASHPDAKFIAKPIQELEAHEVLNAIGLKQGQLDVLVGGPPCQGYSVYNHGRGENDPRAGLFKEYIRLVRGVQPKWIVMENVTGLLSIANGKLINQILTDFRAEGYLNIEFQVLKSEEFGVPQERRRIVFIANRLGIPVEFPKPTLDGKNRPFVNIWDAISDLPKPKEPMVEIAGAQYVSKPLSNYQKAMRSAEGVVQNHYGPKLGVKNLERLKYIPQGGSWRDIPLNLLPEGMKRAKRSDHTKRYGRPKKTDLACTILTKCDIHWGAYIHPDDDRPFTVREAARLQSFPDDFKFFGSMTEQFVQVGNAVPPLLAEALALKILEQNFISKSKAA